jgi:plasmid stability protein
MANLTLSLEDSLLQQAREAAVRDHTSVNALVRDFLTRYVDAKRRRFESLDALDAIAARNNSSSEAKWSRDELHDR